MTQANNKRIAKNATWLTIRTIITTLVSLYTSRIVLSVLGVDDYGIYGVVGGLTAMMSFLNWSMAGATSRFITYEMGQGNAERLRRTFSSAMVAHILIAAVVVIVAETVGVWFLNCKMNIPPERMTAANWVMQLSIISTAVTITQVPYNALIIAHERMNVYAYVELLNAFLKLGTVYLLVLFAYDKLILYAALWLAVSFSIAMIYRVYCTRKFKEARFKLIWDKSILLPMIKFSGLDLYGNAGVMTMGQLRNILINLFFGVACNAAVSIASAVQSAVSSLVSSIGQAFRPQIIKQYASGNLDEMRTVMHNSITFSVLAISMMAIPIILRTDYIINLWLGQVPLNTVQILRCLLITALVQMMLNAPTVAIHATGNIKRISFYSGSLYLINPAFVWLAFHFGAPVWSAYLLEIVMMFAVLSMDLYFVKLQIPQFRIKSLVAQMMRLLIVFGGAFVLTHIIDRVLLPRDTFLSLVAVVMIGAICTAAVAWCIALTTEQKHLLVQYIVKRLKHRKNNGTRI
jgi:O-antigen/teichoic acid export membrane protein